MHKKGPPAAPGRRAGYNQIVRRCYQHPERGNEGMVRCENILAHLL